MSEGLNAEHEEIDRALKTLNCDIAASECHGVLCGMLCSAKNFQVASWLRHTLGYQDDDIGLQELAANPAMQALLGQTLQGLESSDFSFALLLPEDDCALALRVEALGGWCRGFLSGFGLSDLDQVKEMSEDTQDYLRDLLEIGKVDPQALEAEGDEASLFEVQEYARMGALLVHEEFRRTNNGSDPLSESGEQEPSSSIH